jgi:hypothetical protein
VDAGAFEDFRGGQILAFEAEYLAGPGECRVPGNAEKSAFQAVWRTFAAAGSGIIAVHVYQYTIK